MKENYSEYVVWGHPAKDSSFPQEDMLLLAMVEGEPITSQEAAERYMLKLQALGCHKMRIQRIDFSEDYDPQKDFVRAIN